MQLLVLKAAMSSAVGELFRALPTFLLIVRRRESRTDYLISSARTNAKSMAEFACNGADPPLLWIDRGRLGFDVGHETSGACRGAEFLVNPAANI